MMHSVTADSKIPADCCERALNLEEDVQKARRRHQIGNDISRDGSEYDFIARAYHARKNF